MAIKYNFNNKYTLDIALRLSVQRALLCEVMPNVRMVAIDWDDEEQKIFIYFYIDGEISTANIDSASCVAGEVIADFWDEKTQVLETCIRLDFPERLPSHMCSIYRRKEY